MLDDFFNNKIIGFKDITNCVYCRKCKYSGKDRNFYSDDYECFYYPGKMDWDQVIKLAKNHKELAKKLNKNGKCKYYNK